MNTAGYTDQPPSLQTRTSATAIIGFILGLFLCVPFVSGLLGVLFSALGIGATRDPRVKGRGLAIAGLVLSLLNLCVWAAAGGIVMLAIAATAAPRAVMQDFATKMAVGDLVGAAAVCDARMPPEDLDDMQKKFTAFGTFEGLTSWATTSSTVGGLGTCTVSGTIRFSGVTHMFDAELKKDGGPWKVARFRIK